MSRNLVRPYFPNPPVEYSQEYLAEIVRSFSIYVDQIQNPGEGRNTKITLTDLPNSDQGLENGALYQENGDVRITVGNIASIQGVSGLTAIGVVTVTP